ncbi:serine hydrolase domain-containing protein [Streptomyces sp. 7-21]|uniref:serine hydrolase domain-containing protein n=1 Tax=Streptomyces sp. 7-21 TaxID=2802283 RepID=UPI00191DF848|nr:serine hydrolase domain-containing protein [Streptomyces sp. 7-21]MBL1069172.1 beta-lactamase family protein [Streptomyces sp. 7-21]
MTTGAKDLVHGAVAPGFEPLREEFEAVLREEPDHAAQLAVYSRGGPVADLWGGPGMEEDSLIGVFSATKGAAYLTVALLVQRGVLVLDREVAAYWPEFAAEGKGAVTLRELLTHRAGVIGTPRGFSPAEVADDAELARQLAPQRPFWRPGAAFGYHSLTIGALAGEVVRRATGVPLQQLYERELREPTGAEFYLGLPEELEPRVVSVLPPRPQPGAGQEAGDAPDSLAGIAANLHAAEPTSLVGLPNSRAVRAGGQASVGGVASARGLARLYAGAVFGVAGQPPLLRPAVVAEFAQPHAVGTDLVLGTERAYGIGFMTGYRFLGAGAFGHDGAGGAMAFADPRAGLAFGYVRRRVPTPNGAGPDAERLARAARACALGR